MDKPDFVSHNILRSIIDSELSTEELRVVRDTINGSLDVLIQQCCIWEDIDKKNKVLEGKKYE